MAGREEGLSLRDAFIRFRDLVSADMDWADSRKVRYRQRAWRTKVAALVLTAASTVVLGIPATPERAAIALPMPKATAGCQSLVSRQLLRAASLMRPPRTYNQASAGWGTGQNN